MTRIFASLLDSSSPHCFHYAGGAGREFGRFTGMIGCVLTVAVICSIDAAVFFNRAGLFFRTRGQIPLPATILRRRRGDTGTVLHFRTISCDAFSSPLTLAQ